MRVLVRDLDRLRAKSHRPAEVLDLLLLGQQVDHGIRRLGIHLGRVRAVEPAHVARELGDGDVHPEADAEVRNPTLARDLAGEDLALPAARAEAAGDEDAVDLVEQLGRLLVGHVLGVDPLDAHRATLVHAGVLERLVHREVGVVELHVLADERDRRPTSRSSPIRSISSCHSPSTAGGVSSPSCSQTSVSSPSSCSTAGTR